MADLEAVLADVSYLMAMEKSKSTPAARASKKITLPEPRYRRVTGRPGGHRPPPGTGGGGGGGGGGQRRPTPLGRPRGGGGVGGCGSGDAGAPRGAVTRSSRGSGALSEPCPADGARRGAVPACGTSRRDGRCRTARTAGGAGGRQPGAALAALALRSRGRSRRWAGGGDRFPAAVSALRRAAPCRAAVVALWAACCAEGTTRPRAAAPAGAPRSVPGIARCGAPGAVRGCERRGGDAAEAPHSQG